MHKAKDIGKSEFADSAEQAIQIKLDELVALVTATNPDGARVKLYQDKIDDAFKKAALKNTVEAYNIDDRNDLSRADLLDQLEYQLHEFPLDSKLSRQYILHSRMEKAVKFLIGIVLITLGFAMIVMPAPPYFEMFVIFTFNPDDGVTLMDLISLLVILTGVYFVVHALGIKVKQ